MNQTAKNLAKTATFSCQNFYGEEMSGWLTIEALQLVVWEKGCKGGSDNSSGCSFTSL